MNINFINGIVTVKYITFAELNDAHYSFDEIASFLETILQYFNNTNR